MLHILLCRMPQPRHSLAVPGHASGASRRLHSGQRFGNDFDMFDVQRRYHQVAKSSGFRIPAGYDDLLPQLRAAQNALAAKAKATPGRSGALRPSAAS